MPVAPNTSASMIVRTATPNAVYNIYNLGQNQMLAAATPIGAIGDNWNFAGPGALGLRHRYDRLVCVAPKCSDQRQRFLRL